MSPIKLLLTLLASTLILAGCSSNTPASDEPLAEAPIPQASKAIDSSFLSFDKTRIAYSDEGEGDPVILIHGFISNASSWDKSALKKQLLDSGYRVIVPDLRGNGKSDKPQDPEAYQNDAEIKDLIALADHLALKSYRAIGYSRGSIVLTKLLTAEVRISKAVFGGMGIDFSNPNWDRRIAFADAFSGRVAPTEMTNGAVEYAKSIDADLKVLGYLQDYQPVTSVEQLQAIQTESLVICGDQDVDNGDPEMLHTHLSNSTLILVNGDHNNTYKQGNFARAVLAFLAT
ncbi:MAG: alpha/beta fold hydrolase [Saprospiraceae bacterium]